MNNLIEHKHDIVAHRLAQVLRTVVECTHETIPFTFEHGVKVPDQPVANKGVEQSGRQYQELDPPVLADIPEQLANQEHYLGEHV